MYTYVFGYSYMYTHLLIHGRIIHTWDVIHLYVWHYSLEPQHRMAAKCLFHVCNMTHLYLRQDSFIRRHDSSTCLTSLIKAPTSYACNVFQVCDRIHSYSWHTFSHATNMKVSRRTHEILSITHEILSITHEILSSHRMPAFHVCDVIHSYLWHDSFIRVALVIIRTYTMTHSHVYCDSFVRVLWLIRNKEEVHTQRCLRRMRLLELGLE